MEAVYHEIMFIKNVDQLWAMVESGEADWLGVVGEYQVIGRPRRGGVMSDTLVAEVVRQGVEQPHSVELDLLDGNRQTWKFTDADEAREQYMELVTAPTPTEGGPTIQMIRLSIDGRLDDYEVIVRMPETYRDAPPPPGATLQ